MDKAEVIQQACRAAASGQDATARELLRAHYPFQPIPKVKRTCSLRQSIAIFERDGFIDRYQGRAWCIPARFICSRRFSIRITWARSISR